MRAGGAPLASAIETNRWSGFALHANVAAEVVFVGVAGVVFIGVAGVAAAWMALVAGAVVGVDVALTPNSLSSGVGVSAVVVMDGVVVVPGVSGGPSKAEGQGARGPTAKGDPPQLAPSALHSLETISGTR